MLQYYKSGETMTFSVTTLMAILIFLLVILLGIQIQITQLSRQLVEFDSKLKGVARRKDD